MKIYYKFLFIPLISFLLISCSDDDDNPAESSTNPLNGKWEAFKSISGGENNSISIDANLSFDGNDVSGSGTITYTNADVSPNVDVTITESITGTYNNPNISISISDGGAGNVFEYSGVWVTENEIFEGTATITINTTEYVQNNLRLIKDS